jgi:predicted lipoprotein
MRSLFLLPALIACGGGSTASDAADDGFDRVAMLAHLSANLFVPTHEASVPAATALQTSVQAYCTALEGGPADTERDAARAAWAEAVDRWERTEAMLVGPAAMDNKALRDRIYAWPLANTCGVDREVVAHFADPTAYDVTAELANVRSLAAIEYLLFVDATTHTCTTTPEGWDALAADLPRARCGLAAALAADVVVAAELAAEGWSPSGGDYTRELVEAGTSGSSIPSLHEAVNRVSDALFYVDTMVKDMKVGEAGGIVINACGAIEEPCVREVEHRHADRATAAIRLNLRTLREAFTGTTEAADGPSFDDHLRLLGATALADRMTASIDAAIAAADALPDSFLTALAEDRESVVAFHVLLRAFTDDLKSEFLTVLGLEIPDDVAGDND